MGVNDFIKVGSRIKSLRKKNGIKQKDMANQLGIPVSTYANYENNHREPTVKVLDAIADYLNVSLSCLIGWDGIESELKKSCAFENYLRFLEYELTFDKIGQSETGHYEEHRDDEGNIVGRSFMPDEEYYSITISKDKLTIEFSEAEFRAFQNTISKFIEFEIFKAQDK